MRSENREVFGIGLMTAQSAMKRRKKGMKMEMTAAKAADGQDRKKRNKTRVWSNWKG